MVENFSVASLDVLKAVDDVGVDRRFDFKATWRSLILEKVDGP